MNWEAIKSFYLETRSLKAAAERFGVPLNTVKTRARRDSWAHGEGSGFTEQGSYQGSNGPATEDSGFKERTMQGSKGSSQGSSEPPNEPGPEPRGVNPEPSVFSAEVSAYPDAYSPDSPTTNTLGEVLEAIMQGEFRSRIEHLRRILGRDGKAVYDREKCKLPAFCVSGMANATRKKILKHSGLLQLDFDGLNGELANARHKIASDSHVAAAFVSPSGDGLKVIVRIDGNRHDDSVKAATRHFADAHGLKHDPQVKEPVRLCFVSFDPDLYRNPAAEILPLPEEEQKQSKAGRPKKEKPWWSAFKGDLHTLDLSALFRSVELLGECLDPDKGKWAVKCPWADEHGDGGANGPDSDTVIFTGGNYPAFKCFHAHCAERKIEHVCAWFEDRDTGTIDRHCQKMRGAFAGETLASMVLDSPWGEPTEGAFKRLVQLNGEPFYFTVSKEGESEVYDFNPHYWTAQFAFESLVIFEPYSNQFYSYVADRGLWRWQTVPAIQNMMAAYLLDYSRRLNQSLLDSGRTGERLSVMLTILRGVAERRDPFRKFSQVIHVANGMLHLDCDPPELHGFSPHYYSLNQCPVPYDPQADCPRFLRELIYSSMNADDADLLQLVGGLYLTGRNSWQKMLILTGLGGTGKGTIARVIAGIIGRENIKQLRTNLLADRFELDNLDQASLLVGSDVSGDFLCCRGSKVIKALTGGDPLTMEAKGGRKKDIYGDHNVLITCNDRLRVQLDGDESAWKRRLLIIPFDMTPPLQIADFDQMLLREESSGILNWFIVGAIRLAELSRHGIKWPLTPVQEERVDSLLAESDSLRMFVQKRIERVAGESVTVEEAQSAYENFCAELGWVALSKARIERQLGPLMMEFHRSAKRNDIARGSSQKRGYQNVRLIEGPMQTDDAQEYH